MNKYGPLGLKKINMVPRANGAQAPIGAPIYILGPNLSPNLIGVPRGAIFIYFGALGAPIIYLLLALWEPC